MLSKQRVLIFHVGPTFGTDYQCPKPAKITIFVSRPVTTQFFFFRIKFFILRRTAHLEDNSKFVCEECGNNFASKQVKLEENNKFQRIKIVQTNDR